MDRKEREAAERQKNREGQPRLQENERGQRNQRRPQGEEHGQRNRRRPQGEEHSQRNGRRPQGEEYGQRNRTQSRESAGGRKENIRRQKEQKKKRRRRARRRFFRRFFLTAAVCVLLVFLARTGWNYLQSRMELSPERLAAEGYPESLIELVQKNPETKEFVLDYLSYQGPGEIDISGEVTQGEIPFFLQWDERWGYETYGSDFLAVTGCGPTCLSMVLCGLTGDTRWNPLEVARWAEEQGYYVDGSGSSWELMSSGASSLGLQVSEVIFDEQHILSALESGMPIICVMGPGDFTTSGHFLVLTGVDDSGRILLKDPNSRIRTEKSWDLQDLMGQMRNLWAYSC